jgi:hypothetical protein
MKSRMGLMEYGRNKILQIFIVNLIGSDQVGGLSKEKRII